MGFFLYNSGERPIPFEDRTLAHLRLVIMTKLRRRESFMLKVPDGGIGHRWVWISADIPLGFEFSSCDVVSINRHWLEQLLHNANSPEGLFMSREPNDGTSAR